MNDVINSLESFTIVGNSLLSWTMAIGTALALYLFLSLFLRFLRSKMHRFSQTTSTVIDDLLVAVLGSTKVFTLFFIALWAGSRFLDLGRADNVPRFVLVVVVTLQVALWANRAVSEYIVHFSSAYRDTDPGTVSAVQGLSFVARLAIWALAVLLVIDNLGYDVTALVAGLGIGGVAIALAVQNILGDLFASLSIVLDKPFVVGDFIIIDEHLGEVEKIGIKTTRLRSLSGEQLIFANSDLLNSRVRNFKRMYERRVPFNFGVIYQTTPEQLESIPPMVKDIIQGIDKTRFDRAHFKGFGESAYDFEVVYYVLAPDYNVYMDIQQQINLALCRNFAAGGIEFAYPTRTLFLSTAVDSARPAPL
ncbi:MAG: mechanosensitive ion channel family protein [Halioglobus sp.]